MKKWQCIVCGWIYDEAEGYEDEGIAPVRLGMMSMRTLFAQNVGSVRQISR